MAISALGIAPPGRKTLFPLLSALGDGIGKPPGRRHDGRVTARRPDLTVRLAPASGSAMPRIADLPAVCPLSQGPATPPSVFGWTCGLRRGLRKGRDRFAGLIAGTSVSDLMANLLAGIEDDTGP